MYPVNTPQMPIQQPYNHTSQGPTFSGQPNLNNGSAIELSVSCTNLKDKDVFSKSDPVCLLFEKQQERWIEIGRTEMILNELNPRWTKKIQHQHQSSNHETTQI